MRARWIVFFVAAACGGKPGAPQLPTWDRTLPPAQVMGSWRDLLPARGIVHLHSPYSHDACDNMPRDPATGAVNEPCLDDLRLGLCTDQIDFAALSDHKDTMSQEDFPTLFSMRDDDVAVLDDTGEQIASRMTCPDGHVVTFTVGTENDLMPIMLHHHVPGDLPTRYATYASSTPDAIAQFRAAGGLAWIAHTEEHDITELEALVPDGIEVYNLHANIDPTIRSTYLGLDPSGAIAAAADFADTQPGHPEPDLALLGFLSPNQPAIDRWTQLLVDGHHIPTTAGSDAHENALPIILADGERGDSYRRVLRWFGNIAMVTDPQDPAQIESALQVGQFFSVFELFGTPIGFDVHAVSPTATTELGGQVAVSDGATLNVSIPSVRNLDPTLPPPDIRAAIIRIDSTGATTIVDGEGPTLTAPLDAPGAYRVEISIVPHHLGPYLADLGTAHADARVPWIYANPIYVQ
jgi:hypothetical protein